jgi:1-pyrroline-5-carboxylate dehydrogenase
MTAFTGRPPVVLRAPAQARAYAAGSPERGTIAAALADIRSSGYDVPTVIGGREVRTGKLAPIVAPHQRSLRLGQVHQADAQHVIAAIAAAKEAARTWGRLSADERAAPFRRAADMLEYGPWRDRLNAAAMLELSKTAYEADIDASCETADFLRAGIRNLTDLYDVQPDSPAGVSDHLEYRPLEGFVFAVTPFNFVSTCNLAFGPALLGNTVVWKPAESASLVAHLCLQLLREAGLPDGVVNLVHGAGSELGPAALLHRDLSAVHFTGSTATFRTIWTTVGGNIGEYRDYPRLVGETGGKGFILAHPSADLDALAVACVRGAYEYQGQKCSAASRLYVPRSLWPALRDRLVGLTRGITVGDPTVPGTYVGAVINARQFAKHEQALARAREQQLVLVGGKTDDSQGWFVDPTILEVTDPLSPFMTEEFFGPILSAYVYDDADWTATARLVDESTVYGLTGAVFATDEHALAEAGEILRYTAGNFSINDKPTSAAVGQQPFGGSRASGTNDKTGTVWNSIRFVSPRTVKRNHRPAQDYRYPHLEPEPLSAQGS